MSTDLPPRPQRRRLSVRRSFTIVASQYNKQYVDALVASVRQELETISAGTTKVYEVPGAFEIPLVVQELAARGESTVIIALGVIIEGQTRHGSLIAHSVTQALQQIALQFRTPIIHEVLFVQNEEQARARCMDPELNRGTEAARSALQIAQVMSEVKAR